MAVKYYVNLKNGYIYTGNMQEGDRLATEAEVAYWEENHSLKDFDIVKKLEENTKLYNQALNKPLPCGNCFVIADWMSTYSNTLTLAKKYTEEGKEVSANIVVLNALGKLENIVVSSYKDFEPFYNVVADEWARLIDLRNRYMVEIQNSDNPKSIEIDY